LKNILIYSNRGDPIYIAVSSKAVFHVMYQGESISAHTSVGAAVQYAASEFSLEDAMGIFGWQPII
jgi:hypothetical protein